MKKKILSPVSQMGLFLGFLRGRRSEHPGGLRNRVQLRAGKPVLVGRRGEVQSGGE